MLQGTAPSVQYTGRIASIIPFVSPLYPCKFTSRKVFDVKNAAVPDSFSAWTKHYEQLAVINVRSDAVAHKIGLHLQRFVQFFRQSYGHDRLSSCLRRDVVAWQSTLQKQGLAPATINNHIASLSGFTTWVCLCAP